MSEKKIKTRGTLLKNITDNSNCISLKNIGVLGTKTFKTAPSSCPNCESDRFIGLEILGTCKGPLLWLCETCKNKFLKYTVTTTMKYLTKANELYSSPTDWEGFQDQEAN